MLCALFLAPFPFLIRFVHTCASSYIYIHAPYLAPLFFCVCVFIRSLISLLVRFLFVRLYSFVSLRSSLVAHLSSFVYLRSFPLRRYGDFMSPAGGETFRHSTVASASKQAFVSTAGGSKLRWNDD